MKRAANRPSVFGAALPRTLVAGAVLALAGCSGNSRDGSAPQQSGAPGHVSAGGATSGEVIAQAKGSGAQGSAGPQGTPGIPQGAGGNTGGPNMGGATAAQAAADPPGQASSDNRPGTGAAPSGDDRPGKAASPAGDAKHDRPGEPVDKEAAVKEAAKVAADQQQQQLIAAMDRAAVHWRERQANQNGGTPADAVDASRASPAQQPPRSEKHGSAPASEDVKQPQEQSPEASGASLPSDAYKHGQ